MKRAVVTLLALSLVASAAFAQDSKAQCMSLEHVRGAWRMQIKCEQGTGAIVLLDQQETRTYRGEGVFAKWSQQQMDAMYQSLVPQDSTASESLQLG